MRTVCDVCESAGAILFCAADEAALCAACDHQVHMCNKLASRHVRVRLADPSDINRESENSHQRQYKAQPSKGTLGVDSYWWKFSLEFLIENAPAFFYCEIDGSSLCLQCDMIVHVGGKRKHKRYLMLRQRVESLGDQTVNIEDQGLQSVERVEATRESNYPFKFVTRENQQSRRLENQQNQMMLNHQNRSAFPVPMIGNSNDGGDNMDTSLFDLNTRPHNVNGQTSNNQYTSNGAVE